MVQRVTDRQSLPTRAESGILAKAVTTLARSLPWGTLLVGVLVTNHSHAPPTNKPVPPVPTHAKSQPSRPGCTAADNAIVAKGHLDGLAQGFGGFGVLRISKERLEEAAQAAHVLGKNDLSREMNSIASQMPQVHTPQEAAVLAKRLDLVVKEAWQLGSSCKGDISPEQVAKARELATRVSQGKLTTKEAIEQLRRS